MLKEEGGDFASQPRFFNLGGQHFVTNNFEASPQRRMQSVPGRRMAISRKAQLHPAVPSPAYHLLRYRRIYCQARKAGGGSAYLFFTQREAELFAVIGGVEMETVAELVL
jgi:hypothetical protein